MNTLYTIKWNIYILLSSFSILNVVILHMYYSYVSHIFIKCYFLILLGEGVGSERLVDLIKVT